jgi:hypothetical protein
MKTQTPHRYLLLCILIWVLGVASKNKGPTIKIGGRVEHLGVAKSPPVVRPGATQAGEEQAAVDRSVSPEHVFYRNYQVNVSWEDPDLQRRLVCERLPVYTAK